MQEQIEKIDPLGTEYQIIDKVAQLQKDAEGGNTAAQNHLAQMYLNLAQMYLNGIEVYQDHRTAVKWFKKAAVLGDAYANHCVGVMCENGQGVARNRAEAIVWYKEAAKLGRTSARNELLRIFKHTYAMSYTYSKLKMRTIVKRLQTFDELKSFAIERLAEGSGGATKEALISIDLLEELEDEIAERRKKAAEQGDAADAADQFDLGRMYENGQGVEQNRAEAIVWYKKAANQGSINAENHLNHILLETFKSAYGKSSSSFSWTYLFEVKKLTTIKQLTKFAIERLAEGSGGATKEALKSIGLLEALEQEIGKQKTPPTTHPVPSEPPPSKNADLYDLPKVRPPKSHGIYPEIPEKLFAPPAILGIPVDNEELKKLINAGTKIGEQEKLQDDLNDSKTNSDSNNAAVILGPNPIRFCREDEMTLDLKALDVNSSINKPKIGEQETPPAHPPSYAEHMELYGASCATTVPTVPTVPTAPAAPAITVATIVQKQGKLTPLPPYVFPPVPTTTPLAYPIAPTTQLPTPTEPTEATGVLAEVAPT